ncbi:aminotransferase class V-fold PLP-dependent enzyme [Mycoplasma bradburyae]|uniref:aminotransferase class V-fold PLP-dependent enzyme n=1 Tax=Mycoplasma bradburyae TaxID=2963128 RepID=UPI0023416EE7|nr:aminotransferase class V-fold PLP-dependent enzyme [Mycoplasma bradburyae]MDC4182640.1 aminotransferase class V-fold PLP-dependent enzyme [Mycoplasma bradburyae]
MKVQLIREQFSWLKNNKDWIYFDNSATSLKPDVVINSISDYYQNWSLNPHNKDTDISNKLNVIINETREKTAKYLDVNANEIIFNSSATEILNLFSFGLSSYLKSGDEIIVNELEHASNLVNWIELAKRNNLNLVLVKSLDEIKDKVNAKTKVVSFSALSNVFGYEVDYLNYAKTVKTKNKDCLVFIDATQLAAHKKIEITEDIDGLCFSAHKIFGPTGLGIGYIKKALQKTLKPLKYGGDMYYDFNINNKTISFKDNPLKYEAGTNNIASIYAWSKSLDFINDIHENGWYDYEQELVNYFKKKVKEQDKLILINQDCSFPIFLVQIPNIHSQDLAWYLSTKKIVTRAGVSCVHLLKNYQKDGYVRVSLSVYNTKEEIDYFFEVIKDFELKDVLNELF